MSQPPASPSRTAGPLLGATLLTTGLVAGVYFCFTCAIMLALADVDDRTFVEVLQRINERIENPLFFAAFFGALLLGAVAVYRHHRLGDARVTRWIAVGVALYLVGMFITMGGNIPLNNRLADAGDPSAIPDPAGLRADIEDTWNAWNAARTAATTAALAALARATFLYGRADGRR